MDIASLLGLIIALVSLLGLLSLKVAPGNVARTYGTLIVFGGTIAATVISNTLGI